LVDHNEQSQSVENIDRAEILEIIDHHRLGSLETIEPVYFRNQPLGCTATIVYQMYREQNLVPTPKIAGIMCAAILSDTLMFKSPTCTRVDEMTARELALIAEININEFAMNMFAAGSDLQGKSMHEVLHLDFKKFIMGDKTVGISQINSLNVDELSELKDSMMEYLNHRKKTDSDIIICVLTHILEEGSDILCAGEEARTLCGKAFGADFSEGYAFLPGVVSRKKQIVPALLSAMQEL
jgi:manganese-dependent inorganic pyrophosphatase